MTTANKPGDKPRKLRDLAQTIKTNETVKLLKKHFAENKKFYMGAYVGATTCLILVQRHQINNVINNVINNAPVFNNSNTVNLGGHMFKIVEDLATGDLTKKVTVLADQLAKEHGVTYDHALTVLSKHLNHPDLVPDAFGKVYAIAGTGTTGA